MTMIRARVLIALLAGLTGVGCVTGGTPGLGDPGGGTATRYRGTGMVLEGPGGGPELCRNVHDSYPPQCWGLPLVGWDWGAVEGEESVSGVTWGDYEITATWDGERLTLTEPPGPADPGPPDEVDFSSPCPEPPGGWAVVDPATTTQETLSAALDAARVRPDYAGSWLDQPIRGPQPTNDPTDLVLNVKVTGDTAAAERDLRAIWGGALCVSPAERTYAELQAIQAEIGATSEEILMTSSGVRVTDNTLGVEVMLDHQGLQATYDERYGPGVVVVRAWLQPVA